MHSVVSYVESAIEKKIQKIGEFKEKLYFVPFERKLTKHFKELNHVNIKKTRRMYRKSCGRCYR